MMTTLDYRRSIPASIEDGCRGSGDAVALPALFMWAIIGLALTALTFALGFGEDVIHALAAAG